MARSLTFRCLAIPTVVVFGLLSVRALEAQEAALPEVVDYEIKIDTLMEHDGGVDGLINFKKRRKGAKPDTAPRPPDGRFFWYHARATAMPGVLKHDHPAVLLTLHKHFLADDHYSGTYVMRTNDLGRTWSRPDARPELAWVNVDGMTEAVIDSTPGWHAPTRKAIVIGARIHYGPLGQQLNDVPRSRQTMYTVHDPQSGSWTKWQELQMPADEKFNTALCGCSQWVTQEDGTLLLPMNFATRPRGALYHVAVLRCSFDGRELKYLSHGNDLELVESTEKSYGLAEPSLTRYQGRYFMTLRSRDRGYVTASDDGLHFFPLTEWKFDDGTPLGNYNTQQHWLTHSDGLFLVYTRRGANNDHVPHHRAPLFIGQVDPVTLRVMRKTERILIPERGGEMGNFGANAVTKDESWVTVSEGVWLDEQRERGAKGATFVARIFWSKSNRLLESDVSKSR